MRTGFVLLFIAITLNAEVIFNSKTSNLPNDPRELYLDSIKKCILNTIYEGGPLREKGLDWPEYAHSMIGLTRMNNLHFCMKDAVENKVPGDFIETGVWRGGATIFMRAFLKAYQVTERRVWVADSFQGLPAPNPIKYPQDAGLNLYLYPALSVSLDQVMENFEAYGLLDHQVVFVKGWFCNTLPTIPIEQIAVLRLDGDMYESTIDALTYLYPKLSIGGYTIIDDYNIPQCKSAVHDYRNKNQITDPLIFVGNAAAYWKKTK